MTVINTAPPHDLDAERAILGSLLIDPDARPLIAALIQPGDFYRESHGTIYAAMLACGDMPSDVVTVCSVLDRQGHLADVGGPAYVTGLINCTPTSVHAEHYARLVSERAVCRRVIQAATQIVARAWKGDADDALTFARKALRDVDTRNAGGLVHIREVAGLLYDKVETWANNPLPIGEVRGLATGIRPLDNLLDGIEPGWLVILAARPGVGKSSIAFEIARRVGIAGQQTAIFSLEMRKENVLARWASAVSGVEYRRVRRGLLPIRYMGMPYAGRYLADDDLRAYLAALGEVQAVPGVWIDDSRALSVAEIRARSMRQADRVGGLDLIVVDHTGRIRGESNKGENTATVEGRKSKQLSDLAQELSCPVLLVQQLNREAGNREDKRPTMDDLRGSGEHEENADIILGLYRESYYKPNVFNPLELEILVLKHREGPAGKKTTLLYEQHLSRFTEPAPKKEKNGNGNPIDD